MGKKTVEEFKEIFGVIKKPKLPKNISAKDKSALEKDLNNDQLEKFFKDAANLYKSDPEYFAQLVAYKLTKHFDNEKKRPAWLEHIPPDARKAAIKKIVPGDISDPATLGAYDKAGKSGNERMLALIKERDPIGIQALEIQRRVDNLLAAKDLAIDQLVGLLASLDTDIANCSKLAADAKLDSIVQKLADQVKKLKQARSPDVLKPKLEKFLTSNKPGPTTDLKQRQQLWRAWSESRQALGAAPSKGDLALADQELSFQTSALESPKTRTGPDEELSKEKRVQRVEARRAQVKAVVDDLDGMLDAALKAGRDPASNEVANLAILRGKAAEDLKFARMDPSDPYKAALYEKDLRAAMLNVETKLKKVDANDPDKGEPSLLERLGTQMTKYVDEMVSEAVAQYAKKNNLMDGSYRQMMDQLLATNDGEALFKAFPGLKAVIDLEIENFARNMGEVCDRAAKDQKVVADKLLGGAAIEGVKDIYVADSDPHNGGRRVTILTLQGEDGKAHKVVNKPRDVRVDAKFVGKTDDRSSFAERASDAIRRTAARREKIKRIRAIDKAEIKKLSDDEVAKLTDKQVAKLTGNQLTDLSSQIDQHVQKTVKDMPTIGYVVPKDDTHYGWVEYLEHGGPDDCLVDVEGAKNFYKQAGRMAAMAQLLRIEDLHQGNIMVSKGQPQLTDLEIAFSSKMDHLDEKFNKWKTGGKKKTDVGEGVANLTMIDKGLVKADQIDYKTTTTIEDDKLVDRETRKPMEVTENHIILKEGDKLTTHVEGLTKRFNEDLIDGFSELVEAMGDPEFKADEMIDSFRGVHVRYHALATLEQKAIRRDEADKGFPDPNQAGVDKTVVDKLKTRPKAKPLTAVMQSDLKKRDVAYFTQELGSKDVLHNGKTAIKREGGEEFFETDGLTDVKKQFAMLKDPEGQEYMKQVGKNFFGRLATMANNDAVVAPQIKESVFPKGVAASGTPTGTALKTQPTATTTSPPKPTAKAPKVATPPTPEQRDYETAQDEVSNKLGFLKGVDAVEHGKIYAVYKAIYEKRERDWATARNQMRQLKPAVEKALRDKAATLGSDCDAALNNIGLLARVDVRGDAPRAKVRADKIQTEGIEIASALAALEEVERGPTPPADIKAMLKKARQDAAKARNALKTARQDERVAAGTAPRTFDETVKTHQASACEGVSNDAEKELYHEEQKGNRCGLHAANAFFGKPGAVKAGGLYESSEAVLATSDSGAVGDSDPTDGNDPAVLVAHIAELAEAGGVDPKYKDIALAEADDAEADGWDAHTGDRLIVGAKGHFVAFRKDAQGAWWQVDSQKPKPEKVKPSDFIKSSFKQHGQKVAVIHC
jgi:hypothetical protein